MEKLQTSNLVLIGMPGSGKSTVGKRLAKQYGLQFVDADKVIERSVNMPLQAIVDNWGLHRFSMLEQQVLCDLNLENSVISTGGSAVYGDAAMRHLGESSLRLYLEISRQSLLRRVDNSSTRGLFKFPSHSLMRLYAERESLYPQYADVTFENDAPLTAVRFARLCSMLDAWVS